jgi:tripartite ATP-independent transporter DctP family solute receptor
MIDRHGLRSARRIFLHAAVLASMLVSGAALAQGRTLLRISTPAVADDWHARMWTVFKDELDKAAPGQFEVQIHLNGSLFKQGAEPTAMARGSLEMATLSAQDVAKILPEYSIYTAGYLIRDPAHQQKVFNGPIGEEMARAVAARMDVQLLTVAYLGTRQLALREPRPVRTPADLKGVKLRMPASKEWLFLGDALGATATPMAFGEVYLALKTGTIDAQDNPLPTVRSAKFHEVTKQIVLTGHLVDGLFISISSKTWKALRPEQQSAVKAAAVAAARYNNDNRLRDEAQLLEYFKSQGLQVSTPDVEAFRKAVQAKYLASELAKSWPAGLLDRINAVK